MHNINRIDIRQIKCYHSSDVFIDIIFEEKNTVMSKFANNHLQATMIVQWILFQVDVLSTVRVSGANKFVIHQRMSLRPKYQWLVRSQRSGCTKFTRWISHMIFLSLLTQGPLRRPTLQLTDHSCRQDCMKRDICYVRPLWRRTPSLRTWVVFVLPVLLRSLAIYRPISETLILPRPLVTWPTSEILVPPVLSVKKRSWKENFWKNTKTRCHHRHQLPQHLSIIILSPASSFRTSHTLTSHPVKLLRNLRKTGNRSERMDIMLAQKCSTPST